MEKLNENLISEIKKLKISTSTIIDVMDGMKTGGVLSHKIRSQNTADYYLVAQAYTVQWCKNRKGSHILTSSPSTWEQVGAFLVPELERAEGLVYVAGSGECICDAALAGGMSCTYFEQMGFAGVITGGAVRDAPDLQVLAMPVLATNLTPADTQGAWCVSETGTSCRIEQVTIQTGDLIIADSNGVVVIPYQDIDTVTDNAIKMTLIENRMMEQIRQGVRLPDLIEKTGQI